MPATSQRRNELHNSIVTGKGHFQSPENVVQSVVKGSMNGQVFQGNPRNLQLQYESMPLNVKFQSTVNQKLGVYVWFVPPRQWFCSITMIPRR
mmetsp:Transcript_24723/g.70550  ORF Transcript_24723/g.70550 Transcript_24723/m.70550 type:complete len:93 (+) Transcript_24723:207-485(+)